MKETLYHIVQVEEPLETDEDMKPEFLDSITPDTHEEIKTTQSSSKMEWFDGLRGLAS